MNPLASLVTEIEDTLERSSDERRVQLLQRITSLFIDQVPDLNDDHISVFDEVILCLALEIEFAARVELSERLADLTRAPKRTLSNLVHDPHIDVAQPVLERSPCVTNEDLVAVAREGAGPFLAALSRRSHLSTEVTDILVERGDEEVVQTIATNAQSSLSAFGLRILAERATVDNRLYRVLRGRPDLALRHVGAILEAAKQRAKAEMQDLTDREDLLESVLAVGSEAVFVNPGILELAGDLGNSLPDDLYWPTERISEDRILTLVERGRIADAIAALAKNAELPRDMVRNAFATPQFDPILFVIRALGFGWPLLAAFLKAKSGGTLPQSLHDSAHASFHALSRSTAQRVLRFISVRSVL